MVRKWVTPRTTIAAFATAGAVQHVVERGAQLSDGGDAESSHGRRAWFPPPDWPLRTASTSG